MHFYLRNFIGSTFLFGTRAHGHIVYVQFRSLEVMYSVYLYIIYNKQIQNSMKKNCQRLIDWTACRQYLIVWSNNNNFFQSLTCCTHRYHSMNNEWLSSLQCSTIVSYTRSPKRYHRKPLIKYKMNSNNNRSEQSSQVSVTQATQ